ncbi:MAG: helix-turn-helix domain-containing protein [Planctomycetes bacterium]|nr:helix-turn-helix domain-containing protein [Planctomycetota bacterium]
MDGVADELASPAPDQTVLRATATLLAHAVVRGAQTRHGGLTQAQLRRCAERVGDDPWCSPADLARAIGLSPDWFARVFQRAVGESARRWIMRRRLHIAAERLAAGDQPVASIARQCR